MYAIVVGCGRLGSGLARVLSAQGNDVVVVAEEIDAKWLGAEFDGVTIEGNPVDEEVLESAGIRKAWLFVAATSDDVVNAMAVQVASEIFHVPHALARMTDPAREHFYRGIGIETVCPTSTGINQILDVIQKSAFSSLKGYIDPDLAGVMPPLEWLGVKVEALPLPEGRSLIGIERKGRLLPPGSNAVLAEGDVLIMRRKGKEGRAS